MVVGVGGWCSCGRGRADCLDFWGVLVVLMLMDLLVWGCFDVGLMGGFVLVLDA